MRDKDMTKVQLLDELRGLRTRLTETERLEAEYKQACENLKNSEERLKLLFEFAPDGYYLSDLTGRFVDGNRVAEEITGYKRRELIGKSFLKLKILPPDQIPKAAALLARNALGKPTGPDQFSLNRKDGQRISVEIRTFPVSINGRAMVLGMARDITERVRAEEALRKAHEDLEIRVRERTAELTKANKKLKKELTERKRAEGQVRHRLAIEKALAQASKMLVSGKDSDFNQILRLLGEAVSANRAYIFQFRENGQKADNTYEWCDDKTEPQIENLQDVETERVHWWMNKLRSNEDILIPDVDGLPDEADTEKRVLQSQNIQSLAVVPIGSNEDGLLGFMGFDDTERCRPWSTDDTGLLRVVSEMISAHWHRRKTEEVLRYERAQLLSIFDSIHEMIYVVDPKTYEILYTNKALREAFHRGPITGLCYEEFQGLDSPCEFCTNAIVLKEKDKTYHWEHHNPALGRDYMIADRIVKWPDGRDVKFTLAIDITERKRLEDQVTWSQKMETVGRLAAGIAHEFNNILVVIMSSAELALMKLPSDSQVRSYLRKIISSTDFASEIVSQLLAFSRRQLLKPETIDVNEVLHSLDKVLRPLIGGNIELVSLSGRDLGRVRVDRNQIEQVLVNLVMNARDAMPKGGRLILTTTNVTVDEDYARRLGDVTPGEYVKLTVSDTGGGMSEEIKAHLFEPFFTTKEVGKGAGLGLASCYGIVKQSGGHIRVDSEHGQGTTFKIFLPRAEETAEIRPPTDDSSYLPRGTETVLLVEDEPSVRNLTAEILRRQGYTVMEASNGLEALHIAQEHTDKRIDLVLTDVVMPQMDGKTLAEELKADRPDIRILYFSGYMDDTILRHGILDSGLAFLQKPFPREVLVCKVREVLDR